MKRDELKQLIQGPFATVPTPFDDQYQLDLDTMAELTRWWVENGLVKGTTVIKVAAAMGEGPAFTDEEWPQVLKTTVDAADGKAAIVCGLKPKDTLHTIEDAKRAAELGAIGVQIDLPFFYHPTQDDMVRYFSDISEGVDIGIMIYNTFNFGAPPITAESLLRLADAEYVVAVKWFVPAQGGPDYDDMRQFAHIFNVIDNSLQPVRAHKNGARGYINNTIFAHPPHELKVWELLEAGRYDEAGDLFDSVNGPYRAFMAKVRQRTGGYQVGKALSEVMGRPVGPARPPSQPLNEGEMADLRELAAGFGWPVAAQPAHA